MFRSTFTGNPTCRKTLLLFCLFCLACFSVRGVRGQDKSDCIDEELRSALMKLTTNVAKLSSGKKNTDLIPSEEDGTDPLEILLEVFVDDINSFNPQGMDFRLDIFIKHSWKVPQHTCESYEIALGKLDLNLTEDTPLFLSPLYFYMFWLPDTYIINSKKVEAPTKETNTKVLIVYRVQDTCKLEFVVRLAVIVSCQMNFAYYPVDIQLCPLTMRSYAYPHTILKYNWENKTSAVPMNKDLIMLQHTVRLSKGIGYRYMLGRTYSMIYVNFTFERQITYFLSNVYAPSALIIAICCFSFWLGTDVVPGRISLCVTCTLALVTQMSGLRNTLPPVSYINALDIWMITCLTFVFASLLEFTAVWFIDKINKENLAKLEKAKEKDVEINQNQVLPHCTCMDVEKGRGHMGKPYCTCMEDHWRNRRMMIMPSQKQNWTEEYEEEEEEEEECCRCCCSLNNVLSIDKASRILFPVFFIIFNTIYWPLILTRKL